MAETGSMVENLRDSETSAAIDRRIVLNDINACCANVLLRGMQK